jgi:uncharacterized protein
LTFVGAGPPHPAGFEWDEDKRARNLAKHGVDFIDIVSMFGGELLENIDNRRDYGETRIGCLGELDGRVFSVVYVRRDENRRIISQCPRAKSVLRASRLSRRSE